MTSSVRVLAGDALIALGEKVRGRRVRFAGIEPADYDVDYQRHTDRAGWTAPAPLQRYTTAASIQPDVVKSALADLPDSKLIRNAAVVIADWKPILLSAAAAALTDLDLFIAELRNRADQFEAIERDADSPIPLIPDDLAKHVFPVNHPDRNFVEGPSPLNPPGK